VAAASSTQAGGRHSVLIETKEDMSRRFTLLLVVVGVLAATACGGSSGDASEVIEVTLTDEGCQPAAISAVAGHVEFHVSNAGSAAVTEFEVLDADDRVLGEVENVAPGLHREFTMTLDEGSYITYCPGGATERGTLEVTASG
jgi:iron uptake system component EfeO